MDGFLIDPQPQNDAGPAWVQALYKFGVPSVIALYLIYSLVNGGSAMLADIDRTQRQHTSDTAQQTDLLKEATDLLEDNKASTLRMEEYLRLVCANTAKQANDRATCLSIR